MVRGAHVTAAQGAILASAIVTPARDPMPVDGKPDQGPRGELTPEERAVLERRSGELGRKLDEARQPAAGRSSVGHGKGRGEAMGQAMRLSTELVGGVIVGGGMGWLLDSWLGTKPWLFLLFFLLGTASGMIHIIRVAMQQKTPPPPSVEDERDGRS
jgi:ATP synthase protein I